VAGGTVITTRGFSVAEFFELLAWWSQGSNATRAVNASFGVW